MAILARPVLLALSISISLVPLTAEAGRGSGGNSGGGGRLGAVSSGLGNATGGTGSGVGGTPMPAYSDWEDKGDHYDAAAAVSALGVGGLVYDANAPGSQPPRRPSNVDIDFFAGAQKVHESDGSLSLELAFNEGRFRIGASVTRYYERQVGDDALTLTVPTLYLGVRLDDGGPTRVHLEGGAVGARTKNDPAMDSSVAGLLGGVRVTHRLTRRLSVVGDAQTMWFEHDVRANAVRAGLRFGHVQATVRYFDMNVGPALYGPEVGFSF